MSRKPRFVIRVLIYVALAAGVWLTAFLWTNAGPEHGEWAETVVNYPQPLPTPKQRAFGANFLRLRNGMTQSQVVRLIGEPDSTVEVPGTPTIPTGGHEVWDYGQLEVIFSPGGTLTNALGSQPNTGASDTQAAPSAV